MKATSFLSLITFVLALGLGTAASLNAAAYSWDGGAGNNRWDAADNWNPNTVPSAGDDVTFATNTSLTNGIVNIGGGFKVNSLTVDIPAFGMTHGGNPFINLGDTNTIGQLTFTTGFTTSSVILTVTGTTSRVARMEFDQGLVMANNGSGVARFGRAYLQNSPSNTTGGAIVFAGTGSWEFQGDSYIGKNLSGVGGSVTTPDAVIDVELGNNDHTFSGTVTYGATTAMNVANVLVNSGTLVLSNSAITTSGSAPTNGLVVGTSGAFTGAGSVTGSATISGTLAPGISAGSIGTLTFNDSLTLVSTAEIKMDITGIGAGFHDSIAMGGSTLKYDGALSLAVTGTYVEGATWGLFSGFDTVEGSFSAVAMNGIAFGQSGNIWTGSVGGSSYQFNELDGLLTVVPEPTTIGLLLMVAAFATAKRCLRSRATS